MSLYKQFGTSAAAEVDGVWFPFPQEDGSIVELLISRAGGENSKYKRELRRLLKKHKKSRDIPIEDFKPARDDICQAIADHLLHDWRTKQADGKTVKKIVNGKGELVAYSVARAKRLVLDLPELRVEITFKASDFTNFQDGFDPEAIEKN